jgi:hypothetical protein
VKTSGQRVKYSGKTWPWVEKDKRREESAEMKTLKGFLSG